MHRILLNRARLRFRLVPETPLLIKTGDKGATLLHPERPDMMFVRTERGGAGETVYIPGASLKGVVRSTAERILRSLSLAFACDPLDQGVRCTKEAGRLADDAQHLGDPRHTARVYRLLCRACRTFGSQALGSRVQFADAYPPAGLLAQANATETRSGVAIDRRTGAAAKGKLYNYEVVTGGAFDATVLMTNYELWQLALLGLALREMQEGFVRLGSARSRGLGRMSLTFQELTIDQVPRATAIAGVAVLAPELRESYGLHEQAPLSDAAAAPTTGALGPRFQFGGDRKDAHHEVESMLTLLLGEPWKKLCAEARDAAVHP